MTVIKRQNEQKHFFKKCKPTKPSSPLSQVFSTQTALRLHITLTLISMYKNTFKSLSFYFHFCYFAIQAIIHVKAIKKKKKKGEQTYLQFIVML